MRSVAGTVTTLATLCVLAPCAALSEEHGERRAIADTSARRLIENVPGKAAEARFVYEDIENFLEAYARAERSADRAAVYQADYLDRASLGLQMFIFKYDLTAERLVNAIDQHPKAYARLPETLAALKSQEKEFRHAYREIERLAVSSVFPPTCFLVAAHRGIGSGSTEGPLITIEKESPESVADDLVATLVHEMIHMQQLARQQEAYFSIFSGDARTLLATSVREGSATFFSNLITGGSEHKNRAWDYLLTNEDELWNRFAAEMHGTEMGDWLWEEPAQPGQPQDIGYALGARIVQTLYERAEDKVAAADLILSVTDYPALLEASGYPATRVD
jgi:hypothetical protein